MTESVATLIVKDLGPSHEILDLVVRHASGPAYRVCDRSVSKNFLVRVFNHVPSDSEKSWYNFEEFARKFQEVKHPFLHPVLTAGFTSASWPYVVSADVEGDSLNSVLNANERLAPNSAIDITIAVAAALKYAHELDIVHGNIAPENIFVRRNKDSWQLTRILGFEIEPFIIDDAPKNPALSRNVHYISPEQCEGKRADITSDIYSVGCMLYQMLTGQPPHTASQPSQVLTSHMHDTAMPLQEAYRQVKFPVGLQQIVNKCLSKNKSERYQSLAELETDLQSVRAVVRMLPAWLSRNAVMVGVVTIIVATATVSGIAIATETLSDTIQSEVFFSIDRVGGGKPVYRSQGARTLRTALAEAVKKGADLSHADLEQANLSDLDLHGAKLKGAFLSGLMINTNFAEADLRGATMDKCTAIRANFNKANLSKTRVKQCNLARSDFRNVEVRDATFEQTNFGGASIVGTDFNKSKGAAGIYFKAK